MLSRIMDTITGFPRLGGVQRAYNWSILLPDMLGTIIPGIAVSKFQPASTRNTCYPSNTKCGI